MVELDGLGLTFGVEIARHDLRQHGFGLANIAEIICVVAPAMLGVVGGDFALLYQVEGDVNCSVEASQQKFAAGSLFIDKLRASIRSPSFCRIQHEGFRQAILDSLVFLLVTREVVGADGFGILHEDLAEIRKDIIVVAANNEELLFVVRKLEAQEERTVLVLRTLRTVNELFITHALIHLEDIICEPFKLEDISTNAVEFYSTAIEGHCELCKGHRLSLHEINLLII